MLHTKFIILPCIFAVLICTVKASGFTQFIRLPNGRLQRQGHLDEEAIKSLTKDLEKKDDNQDVLPSRSNILQKSPLVSDSSPDQLWSESTDDSSDEDKGHEETQIGQTQTHFSPKATSLTLDEYKWTSSFATKHCFLKSKTFVIPHAFRNVISSRPFGLAGLKDNIVALINRYRLGITIKEIYEQDESDPKKKYKYGTRTYAGNNLPSTEIEIIKNGGLVVRLNSCGQLQVYNGLGSSPLGRFSEVLILDKNLFSIVPHLKLTDSTQNSPCIASTRLRKQKEEQLSGVLPVLTTFEVDNGAKVIIFPSIIKQAIIENQKVIQYIDSTSTEALYGYLDALIVDEEVERLSKQKEKKDRIWEKTNMDLQKNGKTQQEPDLSYQEGNSSSHDTETTNEDPLLIIVEIGQH